MNTVKKQRGPIIPAEIQAAMNARGIKNPSQLAVACGWTLDGRMKAYRMFTKGHAYLLDYARLAHKLQWSLTELSRVLCKMHRSKAEERIKERVAECYGPFYKMGTGTNSLYQFFRGDKDLQPLREYQLISDVIGLDMDRLASALVGFDISCKELTDSARSVTVDSVGKKELSFLYVPSCQLSHKQSA